MLARGWYPPVEITISAKMARIRTVLIKVAKLESMFSTPIFPKMAVSAAKHADRTAQNCHSNKADFNFLCSCCISTQNPDG